ncbi:amino acid racemase [Draconibacterium sp. IB214405]|uniref:aspartate/glutamate racemase family protein n=1 Tax=Draconibacterium sp. IB214405 TaxID=3097352 RepID=UPI002A18551D|nr:amino acid racemase [Draconibacterium sp. IB214405]MDX8340079.1 amino acid racemase [Draconibacterium sp. IB214405]
MKTIGLVGGTGWVSTQEYYKIINETVNQNLGGMTFPRIVLNSVNYGDIYACNQQNDRDGVYRIIKQATETVCNAGADFVALCANTIHFTYEELIRETDKPILHIADATAKAIETHQLKKVGLLGTRETMELDFYKKRLANFGIEVIVPSKEERDFIHSSIMNELLKEVFLPETKKGFIAIMNKLAGEGAQGMILGCTEIPLLIKQEDYELPLFSTLELHAKAIAEFAIENENK